MPTSGDWVYTGNTITNYIGAGGSITIPTSLDSTPVTTIGNNACQSKSITSVTFNHNIVIGQYSFQGNSGIDVILNANITTTGTASSNAPFYSCSIGSGITISSGATTIGANLFYFSGVTSLTLPSTLTTIGVSTFRLNSISSITFDYAVTLSASSFTGNNGIDVIVNANVSTIGITTSISSPFYDCNIGTGLTINNGVTTIGNYLFSNCGLTSLSLPNTLTTINANAFLRNTNLTAVSFPTSLTTIGDNAFAYCGLISITFNHNITIGRLVFQGNIGMDVNMNSNITYTQGWLYRPFDACVIGTGLTIGSSVTSIPNGLFYSSGITGDFIVPTTLTIINDDAFSSNSLSSVTFNSTCELHNACFANNSGLDVILNSNVTINQTTGEAYGAFYNCNIGTGLTINNGITSIPNQLFRNCGLTYASLPSTITTVGNNAFRSNANLAIFKNYNDSTVYGTDVLTGCMSTLNKGTVYGYLNSTTYDWWFAYYTSTYNFESFIVKTAGAFYYYDNDHDTYIRIRKLLYKNTIFKSSRRLAVYQTDEFKRVRL